MIYEGKKRDEGHEGYGYSPNEIMRVQRPQRSNSMQEIHLFCHRTVEGLPRPRLENTVGIIWRCRALEFISTVTKK